MRTCWAPGCKSGYRSQITTEPRHFFCAPSNPVRLALWNRRIPRDGVLTSKHFLCDLHFEERFIIKVYKHVINGQVVETERSKWSLTSDAEPTKFPNLPSYLNKKIPKSRPCKIRNTKNDRDGKPEKEKMIDTTEMSISPCLIFDNEMEVEMEVEIQDHEQSSSHVEMSDHDESTSTSAGKSKKCSLLKSAIYLKNRTISRQKSKLLELRLNNKKLKNENRKLHQKLNEYENLPSKLKIIVNQAMQNTEAKSKTGHRYSVDWLLDALLIRCKSTKAYRMLRDNGFLPLPSINTLNNSIKSMRPEFGFDKALFAGLAEKLACFPRNECRGVLMFDEIQISKNVDFRSETGRLIGMVDYGEYTTTEDEFKEGDHALVFLFQPHLSGWVQSIGSFCAAGTTPTTILAKLILQAIILLENSGAQVDGLVCDGATTNRAALASFGFSGVMDEVQNKMVNPCDSSRSIYFFCDTPHLLKTVRNNLMKAREFLTPDGTVKLEHYKLLLQHDLNPKTGLRAVPKLTEKHVAPNNFQKMSVKLAAQLFSNSVADGLELYRMHVSGLKDSEATIKFTRTLNALFDLLNGRVPKEGIRLNSNKDKLKELEDSGRWLDDWERHIRTLPEPKQKLFLSRPTCQGLRVTLKSTLELSRELLSDGFAYVLTGKFCQDPLEMFFGIIRQSSGADDHPTANQFSYVYRLLSVSNLVKPGKRGSVQANPVDILMKVKSIKPMHEELPWIPQIEVLIDELLECQLPDDDPSLLNNSEHDYNMSTPEQCIQFYLGGYVAHKLLKFTTCDPCIANLTKPSTCLSAESKLVEIKTRGGLKLPSVSLTQLIKLLELSVQKYSGKPKTSMYQDILNDVLSSDTLSKSGIGCEIHQTSLTARCIHFFIATRLHFLKKSINRNRISRQTKQKLSKVSKLT